MSIGEELKKRLLNIYNNKEFAMGIMTNSKSEKNWKIIIEIIDADENIDPDKLSLVALALGETVE